MCCNSIGLGDFAPAGAQAELDDPKGTAGLAGYIFLIFFGLSVTGAFISALQDFLLYTNDLTKARLLGSAEVQPDLASPDDEETGEQPLQAQGAAVDEVSSPLADSHLEPK